MKRILPLKFLMLVQLFSFGQELPAGIVKQKIYGGFGFFTSGISKTDLSDLNRSLEGNGFPVFSETFGGIGGGGYFIFGNILIGGEGQSLIEKEITNNKFRAQMNGGFGIFNAGYVFSPADKLLVFPTAGIGGGGFSLKVGEEPSSISLNNGLLVDPRKEVEMDAGGMLLTAAIGMDYLFASGEGQTSGWILGLRTGYNYAPGNWNWTWGQQQIIDSPGVAASGPYVKLTFGGGGYLFK